MSEERFKEVFARITADTPDAPTYDDLEAHRARPATPIRFKPWMGAAGAAALVLVVVGAFGLLGSGGDGPDLAAPDGDSIDYVKLEYTATFAPACEGGDFTDNGGFDEATIEIWGPNSDDLTVAVATFPDGSTERSLIHRHPRGEKPYRILIALEPEEYPDGSGFRVLRCGDTEWVHLFETVPPAHGSLVPYHMMSPPPGYDDWGHIFLRPPQPEIDWSGLPKPTAIEWNGNSVLLYQVRYGFEAGFHAFDFYVTEDGRRLLRHHAEYSFSGIGDAIVDYSVVEFDRVPPDSVSFDRAGLGSGYYKTQAEP